MIAFQTGGRQSHDSHDSIVFVYVTVQSLVGECPTWHNWDKNVIITCWSAGPFE